MASQIFQIGSLSIVVKLYQRKRQYMLRHTLSNHLLISLAKLQYNQVLFSSMLFLQMFEFILMY